jgi:hypothetical protein
MPQPETVSSDEILRAAGAEHPVTEGTFLQKTGLLLAASVGALATLVTVALVIKWIWYAPAIPAISADIDHEKGARADRALQAVTAGHYRTVHDPVRLDSCEGLAPRFHEHPWLHLWLAERQVQELSHLLVRCDSRHPFADHQLVNMLGAFVSLNRFQIAHVAHDGIFIHDAVGAQQIAA